MTISEAILAFSREQPTWLRDAMRRLAQRSSLDDADRQALLELMKADCGLTTSEPRLVAEPLRDFHLAAPPLAPARVVLNGLSDVKNTNRLAAGQSLRFAINGITVVYGDNGSGKTGYCRLLKKLCRVRDGAVERLLPDAFARPTGPAEVRVRYTVGEAEAVEPTWRDGTEPPAALRCISVFDSRASPLYVDRDNRIEYLPHGLDLLPRLGAVCQDLGQRLDHEAEALEQTLESPMQGYAAGTEVGIAVGRLVPQTPAASLPTEEALRRWANSEVAQADRLAELDQDLAHNPLDLAALLDTAADAAAAIAATVTNAVTLIGDDALAATRTTVSTATLARQVADLAAQEQFRQEPLPGTGTEPWRLMFEYAKRFSQVAYPTEQFPVTRVGALCLLCQQQLQPEAADRLRRFDEFVRGAAEEHARHTAAERERAHAAVEAIALGNGELHTASLGGFDGADEGLRQAAADMLTDLVARRERVMSFLSGNAAALDVAPLPLNPAARLTAAAESYRRRAGELRASAADAATRDARARERDQLRDRQRLAQELQTILARRLDLVRLHGLRTCRASCDTSRISRLGTDLRREFLTTGFKDRILREVKFLGIGYLRLKVLDRSDRGASLIGVGIDGIREVKNDDVLSEGERKALALACFFAEVSGDAHYSGLVFDDPVSSLDHRHRRRVAQRIVQEAQRGRQVVVFTHDLVFFHELREAAASASPQAPLAVHEVRQTAEHGFGTVFENQEPWLCREVGTRFTELQGRLAAIRLIADRSGDEYRRAVKDFYSDLRESWERFVEAELLAGVVTRFQTPVKTQSLREVTVEDPDHKTVFVGMQRASEWSGHDQAEALQGALPTPDDMVRDLESLRQLRQAVSARKAVTRTRRRDGESAPPGTLA